MSGRRTSMSVKPVAGVRIIELSPTALLPGMSFGEVCDALLVIEQSASGSPWSEGMFISEIDRPDGIRLCAVDAQQQIIGFVFAAPMGGTWHIMNVAVADLHRRRGLGSWLIAEVIERAAGNDPAGYTLEVRSSNEPAQQLYRGFGFRPHGVRPRYYSDNDEDALVMWRPPQAVYDQGSSASDWVPPT